jgi:ABC-type glutathione transport system ATPase component
VVDIDSVSRVAEHEARLTSVEDEDCAKERQRIYDGKYSDDDPLIICNLRKVYPSDPPKVAVKSLCLGVAENECFGLLGENGAGMSTSQVLHQFVVLLIFLFFLLR